MGEILSSEGKVDDFGGATLNPKVGTDRWARLGTVTMKGTESGTATIQLSPGSFSFAIQGTGNIVWDKIGLHDVTLKIAEIPVAVPFSTDISVQEGTSVCFDGKNSLGENNTYWWDLSGTGVFVQKDASFWVSLQELPDGISTIRFKVIDEYDYESEPVSIHLTVQETPPVIHFQKNSFVNDQVVNLSLNADYYGDRTAAKWILNWGDGTQPTTVESVASFVNLMHYYATPKETSSYPLSLTLIDTNGNGSGMAYYLGSHTVSAATKAALPVIESGINVEQPLFTVQQDEMINLLLFNNTRPVVRGLEGKSSLVCLASDRKVEPVPVSVFDEVLEEDLFL